MEGANPEKRNRVPDHIAFQMLMLAGFFDVLFWGNTFLYIFLVGFVFAPIIWLFAWLSFYVWFKIHGISIFDILGKYGLRKLMGLIIKAPPGLPGWTLGTFLTISAVKAEDAIHNKLGLDVNISANSLRNIPENLASGAIREVAELKYLRREGLALARKYQAKRLEERSNQTKKLSPSEDSPI